MTELDTIVARQEKLVRDQALNMKERTELNQLRKTVKGLTDGPAVLLRIATVLSSWNGAWPGRTLGIKINDDLRDRLFKQQSLWGAKTYKQIVMTCIVLGLERLEAAEQHKDEST